MPSEHPFRAHPLYRYGVAVAATLVALSITAALWGVMSQARFVFFTLAVVVSAWQGGIVAGVLCAILSTLSLDYLLVEPRFHLFDSPVDILQFIIFGIVSVLIGWLEEQRRSTTEKLQRTRDELEVILNGVAEGISAQDASGQIVFANRAAAAMVNQPDARAILGSRSLFSQIQGQYTLLGEDDQPLPAAQSPGAHVFETGQSAETVFSLSRPDSDERRWFQLRSSPVLDKDGSVRLVVKIFRDITANRQIERQRSESEARIRKILDNLAAFVGIMTPDGTLIEANRSALAAANLTLDDVIGRPFEDAYWWSYDAGIQRQLREAINRAAAGETVRYDVLVRLAEKRFITIDFMLAPTFDAHGKVEFLIPSGIDVTARNELTARLKMQQHRLEAILNSVPGIVFEGSRSPASGQQKMDFISPYIETVLGYTIDEAMAEGFWEKVVHPDDWEQAVKETTALYQHNQAGKLEFRCIHKNGQIVHLETHMTVIADAQGVPVGVVGVMTEITERKQTEEALAQYAEELRRSNEELEQFAYVASHDLQEPLRMITSYLQLIEKRYSEQLDDDGREFIHFAVDGATRMKALINDVLAYSRIQRGKAEPEPVPMNEALEQALDNLQLAIEDSEALITHDPLPLITANRAQMVQLLQNLIGNALKFRSERRPEIHVGVRREGKLWHFSVRDNGIGIAEEYFERIFIIFQRLHTRGQYSGTGIGLAICKKIVDKHGGRIYAESVPREGTTFHFTLPIERAERRYGRGVYGSH